MRSQLVYIFTVPLVIVAFPVSLLAQTPDLVSNNQHPSLSVNVENSAARTYAPIAQADGVEEYQIQIARPYEVGNIFNFATRGTESISYAVLQNNQEIDRNQESSTLELQASVTVLDVNLDQQMTSVSFDVVQSKLINGETESVPFSQGTNILAFVQDGNTIFEIDGETITEDLEGILSVSIDLLDEGGPSDDEVFGTPNRQQVGSSWNVNSEAASATFENVEPQDISGSITLNAVEDEILFISGLTNIDNGLSPFLDQNEFIVQSDTTVIEFATQLPIEELDGNFDRTTSLTSSISANHRDDSQLRLEMIYEASVATQLTRME
ncbi:MAG: hypothetical protein AAGI69_03870 [Cyanobacteria bacterium P01_H01_bin.21]